MWGVEKEDVVGDALKPGGGGARLGPEVANEFGSSADSTCSVCVGHGSRHRRHQRCKKFEARICSLLQRPIIRHWRMATGDWGGTARRRWPHQSCILAPHPLDARRSNSKWGEALECVGGTCTVTVGPSPEKVAESLSSLHTAKSNFENSSRPRVAGHLPRRLR